MRILVLSREFPPYVLGGISYHLMNLYNRIQELGHEVTVLSGKCPQSWNDLQNEVHPDINVIPIEFGYRKGYYVLYPIALYKRMSKIDTSKFDIAVSHTPLPYSVPGLDMITKYHDCVAETRPFIRNGLSKVERVGDSILHPIRSWIDQKSIQKSDHGMFVSNLNKNSWSNHYDIDLGTSVIYNGVDSERFYPTKEKQDYVLFVGSSERKGLSKVIEYSRHSEYPVHIVGSVNIDKENITCHGRVSQERLRELYSGAIATIHPTKFEAFGNVILESLSCGTPVVTTQRCGAAEILNEDTGTVTDDLVSGIEKVKNMNPDACRETALMYPWEKTAKKTLSCIEHFN